MIRVEKFIERFWKDELQVNLHAFLDRDYYKILEPLVEIVFPIFEQLEISDSVNIEVKRRNPQWVLIAYAELEKELQKLGTRMMDNNVTPTELVGELVRDKKLSYFDSIKFRSIQELRDRYAHTEVSVEVDEVEEFLRIASELVKKIKKM
jgi:hypothetical protein